MIRRKWSFSNELPPNRRGSMAITWFRFSAELPAGRQLLPGAGMDSLHQTPLGFSSDQGEKFVLSAALYSCHYPGDEKVQLYLLWRNFGCSQPNSLSVLKVFFWSTFKWWGYCGKGEGINDFSSVFWLPPALPQPSSQELGVHRLRQKGNLQLCSMVMKIQMLLFMIHT